MNSLVQRKSSDSGMTGSNDVVSIDDITRAQIASAPVVPVSPVGPLSSWPIHTTTRWEPENPANQLSR